ncbi:MAG: ABC transporter permease [Acholeplasmatales bacterium]|nr:ABC transporter permease [Acholeplasmatales bacterium]
MNIDTYSIALIFTVLGLGVFLSFRILNITDLTVEASYAFGALICAKLCIALNPYLALLISFFGGMLAGLITALLHTKLKINAILSGILTLTAFYSVNLIVANGDLSIALKGYTAEGLTNYTIFPNNDFAKLGILIGIVIILMAMMSIFFRTKLGLSIRACGDNQEMAKTQCISTDNMKIIGLMISNGLVALAGALFTEFNASYSTNVEKGVMVVGVATIIIGEVLTFKKHNIDLILVGILGGSIVYRLIYSFILELSFIQARDLQIIQSSFLVVILVLGVVFDNFKNKKKLSNLVIDEEVSNA